MIRIAKKLLIIILVLILSACNASLSELSTALDKKDYKKVSTVISKNKNAIDGTLIKWLYISAFEDDSLMEILVNNHISPNFVINSDGDSVLQLCIRKEKFKYIRPLIDNGADVNFINSQTGYSVFLTAIYHCPTIFLDAFFNAGLDISFVFKERKMSYFGEMLYANRLDMASEFIKQPSVLSLVLQDENTIFYILYYWQKKSIAICDYLWENGLVLHHEEPLLITAIDEMQYDAVQWLLLHGLSPMEKEYNEYEDVYQTAIEFTDWKESTVIDRKEFFELGRIKTEIIDNYMPIITSIVPERKIKNEE